MLDQLRAILAQPAAPLPEADPLTTRARPAFLWLMYAMLLGAIPTGLVGAVSPAAAQAIAAGMRAYLAAIPDPLYALFASGYLGYTVARQVGKAMGTDR